jgi:hypothetical protein
MADLPDKFLTERSTLSKVLGMISSIKGVQLNVAPESIMTGVLSVGIAPIYTGWVRELDIKELCEGVVLGGDTRRNV